MKILYISTNADLSGAPIHLRSLICAFDSNANIEVVFGEEGPIIKDLGRTKANLRVLHRLRSNINPKNDLIVLFQLINLLRKLSPDLVHLHSSKAAMIGRLACIVVGVPWVYTVHGWGWRGFGGLKGKLILRIEKLLSLSSKGRYIYVSKSVEFEGVDVLSIKPDRGCVIFNGVADCGYCPEPLGPLRILMAARVCAAKDHETLVRAFEQVGVASELILCGEGTDTEDFRKKVMEWAPNRYVEIELLGIRDDVRSLLHLVNVFALISNFEALPLSIIEAMASARSVIASNVGGVAELIDPEVNGILVSRGGIQEIASSIERLSDMKLRLRFGSAGRKRYEESFSESKMHNAVWEVYQDTLRKLH